MREAAARHEASAQTQVEQDMRRFKAIMEAGEFPTTAGQPHGAKKGLLFAGEVA